MQVPFGMVLPFPTDDTPGQELGFSYPLFQEFRLTHQPSPWIGIYAWCLTPQEAQVPTSSSSSSYSMKKKPFFFHYLRIFPGSMIKARLVQMLRAIMRSRH